MSRADALEAQIQAGAEQWQPDELIARWHTDYPAAPMIEARAPVAAFDGCHFCLAPSAAARDELRIAIDKLEAAIKWLDAVRGAPESERATRMLRDAVEGVEAYARDLVRVPR